MATGWEVGLSSCRLVLEESYVDLQPGLRTRYKIEVEGSKARLYVHGGVDRVTGRRSRIVGRTWPGGLLFESEDCRSGLGDVECERALMEVDLIEGVHSRDRRRLGCEVAPLRSER
jgi:hypothetical protein